MDQRKRRLALLMLGYMGKILVTLALIALGFIGGIWIVDWLAGQITPGGLALMTMVAVAALFSYNLARDKLQALEREERRVMDRMRMDD